MLDFVVIPAVCFLLGGAGAGLLACIGPKYGLIDRPVERSSHSIPTPKGGGMGMLVAFIVLALANPLPWTFWLPAFMLGMISFLGDYTDISPETRLFFQFLASVVLLTGLVYEELFFAPYLFLPLICIYLVGTTNLYNFMDGINGIAGISGVVGFGLLVIHNSLNDGESYLTFMAWGISLSCLGFLPWNIPRARVFMGDVGSILLGFIFSGLVVFMSQDWLDIICMSAFLFPFYTDELITMTERIKRGESLKNSHRTHLYQILANERGMPHWRVSMMYGLFQIFVGGGVLLLKQNGPLGIIIFLVFCFTGFFFASSKIKGTYGIV